MKGMIIMGYKCIEDLKDLKLYDTNSNDFIIPTVKEDIQHNSCVFLLTPNIESSIDSINNTFINKKRFISYYSEKDARVYFNESSMYTVDDSSSTINEEKLKSSERRDFGLPSLKKYP